MASLAPPPRQRRQHDEPDQAPERLSPDTLEDVQPRLPDDICAITVLSHRSQPKIAVKPSACTTSAIAAHSAAFFGAAQKSTIAITASA